MNVLSLFSWMQANWANIAGAVAALIAAASVLIKACEAMTAILVGMFPSLKNADGTLKHIAWALDAASKWPFLHTLSLAPKAAAKMLALAIVCLTLFRPAPAMAGFDYAVGPTIPLVKLDFDSKVQSSVAPGAGLQLSITNDIFKKEFIGKSWDLLDLDLMAFGTLVNQNGSQFGQLAAAAGFATLSSLLFVGAGPNVLGPDQGKWFMVFALSFNFALSPAAPPVGIAQGAPGLVRGNTLYFGAP